MRTIAIINQKGGCGKTTTAINLSTTLARRGKRTLLIDLDPQSHCAAGLNIPEQRIDLDIGDAMLAVGTRTIDPARLLWRAARNVDLAPSRMRLAALEAPKGPLADVPDRESRLAAVIRAFEGQYDAVCIDCPPSIGLLTYNALVAASMVLIPVETGFFALQGATKQVNTIKTLSKRLKTPPSVWLLPTLHEAGNAVAEDLLAELTRRFKGRVAPVVIHRDAKLREATSFGKAVEDYAPDSSGAADYKALARWLDVELSPALEAKAASDAPDAHDPHTRDHELAGAIAGITSGGQSNGHLPGHSGHAHDHDLRQARTARALREGHDEPLTAPGPIAPNSTPISTPISTPHSTPQITPAPAAAYTPTLTPALDDRQLSQHLAAEARPLPTPHSTPHSTPSNPNQRPAPTPLPTPLPAALADAIVARGTLELDRPTPSPISGVTGTIATPAARAPDHAEAETKSITRAEDVARRAQEFLRRIAQGRAARPDTDDSLALASSTTTSTTTTAPLPAPAIDAAATPLKLVDAAAPVTPPPSIHRIFGVRKTPSGVLFVQPMSLGQRVAVAGSFNDWSETQHVLRPNHDLGVFELCLPLPSGRHTYRLVVDGTWTPDPYNESTEPNGFGGVNCLLTIS
jgi:chromosome partitioning protein